MKIQVFLSVSSIITFVFLIVLTTTTTVGVQAQITTVQENHVPTTSETETTPESPSHDANINTNTNSDTNSDRDTNSDTTVASDTTSNPVQPTGPFIDLLGPTLLSLQMIDDTHAQIHSHRTNDVLQGSSVVGLYFSADWCGPCRRFTPELVTFMQKIHQRHGNRNRRQKQGHSSTDTTSNISTNMFPIVWISRCRDVSSWGQYFTHMIGFYALPPEEAMGTRGNALFQKYKGTSIPYLVLLEGDTAQVITLDARNKITQDKVGIGFPWRSPMSIICNLLFPKSFRFLLSHSIGQMRRKIQFLLQGIMGR